MNKQCARFIVDTLRPFTKERRHVILDRLQERDGLIALTGADETAASTIESRWAFILNLSTYNDTIDEVREAVENGLEGSCDNCDKTGPLKSYDSSSGETDQCYFSCE